MVEVETEGEAPVPRYQRSAVPVVVESACWSGGEQVGKSLLAIESRGTVPLFVPGTCYPERVEVVEEGSLPWSFAVWMRTKKWRGTTVEDPSWGRRLLARVVEGEAGSCQQKKRPLGCGRDRDQAQWARSRGEVVDGEEVGEDSRR